MSPSGRTGGVDGILDGGKEVGVDLSLGRVDPGDDAGDDGLSCWLAVYLSGVICGGLADFSALRPSGTLLAIKTINDT